jgi:hypothetical protein
MSRTIMRAVQYPSGAAFGLGYLDARESFEPALRVNPQDLARMLVPALLPACIICVGAALLEFAALSPKRLSSRSAAIV